MLCVQDVLNVMSHCKYKSIERVAEILYYLFISNIVRMLARVGSYIPSNYKEISDEFAQVYINLSLLALQYNSEEVHQPAIAKKIIFSMSERESIASGSL